MVAALAREASSERPGSVESAWLEGPVDAQRPARAGNPRPGSPGAWCLPRPPTGAPLLRLVRGRGG